MALLGALLSRRDWVYLLSLLAPLAIYDLALKAYDIASWPGEPGLALTLDLMRSDIFFGLGYALLWVGLFATVRGGLARWAMVFFFHIATMIVAAVSTMAHQYFQQTGTTLSYGTIALWLPRFGEIQPILVQAVPLSAWVLLGAVVFYAVLGPWLVTRAVEGWRGRPGRSLAGIPRISFLGPLGLFLLALGFGSLSMTIGSNPAEASTSLARDPFVNVVLTGFKEATDKKGGQDAAVENLSVNARLVPTLWTEKRNVVLIHLESARARSVTPYNERLPTTPFLDDLAKESLLAEQAYTTVPHTSKAVTSVNCGVLPHLVPQTTEADPGGIPTRCLPDLLREQGYDTVFFQSPTENFEDRRELVNNFGYEEFYSQESMDTDGFEQTSYFGYEDDIMLESSEEWIKERSTDEPFMAEYLTGTGHHDYRCLSTLYGQEDFSENDWTNRYLNCMRLQDIFVENLFDQYKELRLYEDTIFVFYGDHGEGLGEHGRYQHDDTPWEEGIRIPLLIHAPGRFEDGERNAGPSNLTDVLPTVLELLGYKVKNGEYPGYSLLRPLPESRILRFSCFHEDQCLASIKGHEKYIYHYDNQPDELFDLSEDPLEKNNLAGERGKEVDERREDLLAWHSKINAIYGDR
ncbi:hypothetical protein BH24ACT19_BH24ACT19_20820 [soil metagenome]